MRLHSHYSYVGSYERNRILVSTGVTAKENLNSEVMFIPFHSNDDKSIRVFFCPTGIRFFYTGFPRVLIKELLWRFPEENSKDHLRTSQLRIFAVIVVLIGGI